MHTPVGGDQIVTDGGADIPALSVITSGIWGELRGIIDKTIMSRAKSVLDGVRAKDLGNFVELLKLGPESWDGWGNETGKSG